MSQRIRGEYLIETALPLEQAAETMASEQSTGTFMRVHGETDEIRELYGAKVEKIEPLDKTDTPALPGAKVPKDAVSPKFQRARFTLSWNFDCMGANIPVLLSTAVGGLYDLQIFSAAKLMDLELPEGFMQAYQGPQFGVEGTRKLINVHDRPIMGTIIKPCLGMSPEQSAERVREMVDAGIDFIKDDEVMCSPPHSPFEERVAAAMRVIRAYADKTGRKPMYAFNLSGDIDDMLRRLEILEKHEATCAMINVLSVGASGIAKIRKHSKVALHGHRCGSGMLFRHPMWGVSFRAYQKLWRILGIDQIHTNGLRNKFYDTDEMVIDQIRSVQEPLFGGHQAVPVLGSGQWAGMAPDTHKAAGGVDLIFLCGGGVSAHPSGPAAGVQSLLDAWQAAKEGVDLDEYARTHPALREAIEKFGSAT